MKNAERIVIIGAGFGGIRAAIDLERSMRFPGGFEIVIIDKHGHHLFTPVLYEVATGYFDVETPDCERLLEGGACVHFERFPALVHGHRISVKHAEVVQIEAAKKTINLTDGTSLSYAYLIIACGAIVDFPPIPGLKEHAIALKSIDDALHVRRLMQEYLDDRRAGGDRKLSLAVCGGGPNGVEVAAETTRFLRHQLHGGRLVAGDYSVTLVEAGARLVSTFNTSLSAWALERLQRLGVRVLLESRVVSIEEGKVVLAASGERKTERKIGADVIVWAGGIRAPSFLGESGLPVDQKGRVVVDATLQVEGIPEIFAIGDCASLIDPATHTPFLQLAPVAVAMGSLAAKNIKRSMLRKALLPFKKRIWGEVIPLGGKWVIGEVAGFTFRGRLGYLMRQLINLRYFFTILPLHRAFRFWWSGVRVYMKND